MHRRFQQLSRRSSIGNLQMSTNRGWTARREAKYLWELNLEANPYCNSNLKSRSLWEKNIVLRVTILFFVLVLYLFFRTQNIHSSLHITHLLLQSTTNNLSLIFVCSVQPLFTWEELVPIIYLTEHEAHQDSKSTKHSSLQKWALLLC